MAKNRVRDWQGFTDTQFRQQVESDLDELDGAVSDGMRALRAEIQSQEQRHQTEMAELKEQQKWTMRTMWALGVGLLMVMAGIVGTVIVP